VKSERRRSGTEEKQEAFTKVNEGDEGLADCDFPTSPEGHSWLGFLVQKTAAEDNKTNQVF
jgi:hypothetical protein